MTNFKIASHQEIKNILPLDGEALYYGPVFDQNNSKVITSNLLESIDWKQDEVIIFGKKIMTKRKVAWYGDTDFSYKYSGKIKTAQAWTESLKKIKDSIETLTDETYNSCLLNLYHDGEEGVSWHSDAEKELCKDAAIASLSFGACRKFSFKHKESKEKIDQFLEDGSLLLMKGPIQEKWQHSLPKSKKIKDLRINLTFRKINIKPI